jgi:hypothetical protein
MLSLYLRKDKSENSSVEILRRTTGMYIFRTTNVEIEDHKAGIKLLKLGK